MKKDDEPRQRANGKPPVSNWGLIRRMLALAWQYRLWCVGILSIQIVLLTLGLLGLGLIGVGVDYIRFHVVTTRGGAQATIESAAPPASPGGYAVAGPASPGGYAAARPSGGTPSSAPTASSSAA